ncbi:hypothetical protein [Bythopirellula goksoeyrii]|uniref:Zinc-finger domain-containing protein n=1 Tax=Bythopirellula goksoeyrii TaxID=1400387 RepID=A0A5B9QRZ8_9BACT|nr:hypothetical protein [Bythopirellula goksoeyrii]QEG36891.1 hypothetical protein Pr1d_42300 [Bythopirellula goksoeyrii]
MAFSRHELENLLRLVTLTKDVELNCEECLALVAEFAEQHLAGKSIRAGLQAVEEHLAVCDECREEYEALQQTLAEIDGDL